MKKKCIECGKIKDIKGFGVKKKSTNGQSEERYDVCISCYILKKKTKEVQKSKSNNNKQILKKYSKDLRKRATAAEKCLKAELLRLGIIHEFQYPILDSNHKYIADFHIPLKGRKNGLVVEVDGKYHNDEDTSYKDGNRDVYFKLRRFLVLRVTNEDVYNNLNEVIERILTYGTVKKRTSFKEKESKKK